MKPVVLITGANGMLAQHLAKQLESAYELRFLTRKVQRGNEFLWDIQQQYIDPKALLGVQHIVHLAGSSIADARWASQTKQLILSSRVDGANLLLNELKKYQISIETFLSASATGYYGTTTSDVVFDENSPKGNDFLSEVCEQWENAAKNFQGIAKRVACIRIGVILAKDEGALKNITLPIKYGLGSGLGSGKQYMPWIHIQDLASIFKFVLDKPSISGVFNAVSPQFCTNRELTTAIAKTINRPIFLPNVPAFVLRSIFGEMSVILLEGTRVSSKKLLDAGFKFKYEQLSDALNNLLRE